MAPKIVTITPLNNNGNFTAINVGLAGSAVYTPSSSSGGWQIVDRPKRTAATQWVDRAPWSISFEGIINHQVTNNSSFSTQNENIIQTVENDCTRLESWTSTVPGTLEPPVFQLTGPIPGIHHAWCLYTLEFGEALRDNNSGMRYQQNVKFTFYEYVPPFSNSTIAYAGGISPTDTYYYTNETITQTAPAFTTYVVKQGETVNQITAKFNLGKDSSAKLLSINNIRDPRSLEAGMTILIPN